MSVNTVKQTSKKVYNPFALFITPYADNVIGENTYKLEEVVRDTTSISQDDPEENSIENEFSAEPLINNVDAGKYNFATNVGDMQGELLSKLAGFTYDSSKKFAYAPKSYTEVFAKVELVFKDGASNYVAAVLPKVQLNSKALLESINTSIGQIAITGVAYSGVVGVAGAGVEAPFYIDYAWTESTGGNYVKS